MLPVINTTAVSPFGRHSVVESDYFKSQLSQWEMWARQSSDGDGECRDIAVERLKACLTYRHARLDLSNLRLTALPDLLPDFLQELDVSDNFLRDLPGKLPALLETLNVDRNRLMCLPEDLPICLKSLDVNDNLIRCLPANLPCYLENLSITGNQLTQLPAILPHRLVLLDVCFNSLHSLPDNLPNSLEILHANDNQLSTLPRLPDSLKELNVDNNRLMQLPARLPLLLSTLDANYNQLSTLPDNLPVFLRGLYVSHNQLTSLPVRLPGYLKHLDVSHNQLVRLPVNLPAPLKILYADDNQLTDLPDNLPHLSELYVGNNQLVGLPAALPDSLERINLDSNPITIFPDNLLDSLVSIDSGELVAACWRRTFSGFLATLHDWDSCVDTSRWRAIHAEDNASIFANFLGNLHRGKNAHNNDLHCRVANWLTYLAGDACQELRKQTFLLAKEATESCVDRASFYFTHMHILMVENELINTAAPLIHIVNTILGAFRLQILERIAAEKTAERRQNSPDFSEDLEIYLAYQCALREPLSLPVYTEIQFERIADITEEDIRQAGQIVASAEKRDFVRHWLTESALWTAKLEQWDPEKKAEYDSLYLDAIAAAAFNEAVNKALNENGISVNDADAQRNVSQALAADLFYQQRYQLAQEYLAAHGALSLLYRFSLPPLPQC